MGPVYVRMRAASFGWTVRLIVLKRATSLLIFDAARVWTALLHCPDGDPAEAIYTPGCHFSSLPHHNLTFWQLVSYFLSAFGFISFLFAFFLVHYLTFQVFFFTFFSSIFLIVRMLVFFWNVLCL
jgi:hypothetical protein